MSASTEEVPDKLPDLNESRSVTDETDTPATSPIKCDISASKDNCYGSQAWCLCLLNVYEVYIKYNRV